MLFIAQREHQVDAVVMALNFSSLSMDTKDLKRKPSRHGIDDDGLSFPCLLFGAAESFL